MTMAASVRRATFIGAGKLGSTAVHNVTVFENENLRSDGVCWVLTATLCQHCRSNGGSWKMYKVEWKTTHKFIKQPSNLPTKQINHQTQPTNLINRDEGLILCSLRLRCHCHRLPRRSQLSPGRSVCVWYSPVL